MRESRILPSLEPGSIPPDILPREENSRDGRPLRPAGRIDGAACRGARAMLGISQTDLCRLARCGRNLLNDFERGGHVPRASSVARIRAALEGAGAVFVDAGDGTVLVGVSGRSRPGTTAGPSEGR